MGGLVGGCIEYFHKYNTMKLGQAFVSFSFMRVRLRVMLLLLNEIYYPQIVKENTHKYYHN